MTNVAATFEFNTVQVGVSLETLGREITVRMGVRSETTSHLLNAVGRQGSPAR